LTLFGPNFKDETKNDSANRKTNLPFMHHYLIPKSFGPRDLSRDWKEEAAWKKPLSAWPFVFGEHEAKRIVFSRNCLSTSKSSRPIGTPFRRHTVFLPTANELKRGVEEL
jgi:hypothetical protein